MAGSKDSKESCSDATDVQDGVVAELSVASAPETAASNLTSPSSTSAKSTWQANQAGPSDGAGTADNGVAAEAASALQQVYAVAHLALSHMHAGSSAAASQLRRLVVMQHNALGSAGALASALSASAARSVASILQQLSEAMLAAVHAMSSSSKAALLHCSETVSACCTRLAAVMSWPAKPAEGDEAGDGHDGAFSQASGSAPVPESKAEAQPAAESKESATSGGAQAVSSSTQDMMQDNSIAECVPTGSAEAAAFIGSINASFAPDAGASEPPPAPAAAALPTASECGAPASAALPAPATPLQSHPVMGSIHGCASTAQPSYAASARSSGALPYAVARSAAGGPPGAASEADATEVRSVLSEWLYQDWEEYDDEELVVGADDTVSGMNELKFCGKEESVGYIPAGMFMAQKDLGGKKASH